MVSDEDLACLQNAELVCRLTDAGNESAELRRQAASCSDARRACEAELAAVMRQVDCLTQQLVQKDAELLQAHHLVRSTIFYRAMLCIRSTSHGPVSVRPSQVGVLLKRLKVGSHKQHHTIAQVDYYYYNFLNPQY